MLFVSQFFSGEMNVIWAAGTGAVWMVHRRYREALFLVLGTTLGSALTVPLKILFALPRPPAAGVVDTFAFPSGHALSITVFSSLLAWLFSRRIPSRRVLYWACAVMMILLVAASRVYLGMHWTRDVIAGVAVGTAFVWGWIRWAGEKIDLKK